MENETNIFCPECHSTQTSCLNREYNRDNTKILRAEYTCDSCDEDFEVVLCTNCGGDGGVEEGWFDPTTGAIEGAILDCEDCNGSGYILI